MHEASVTLNEAIRDEKTGTQFLAPFQVPLDQLKPNDYNPNRMPREEMRLLETCIKKYGFLFPIIATWDEELQRYRIIDGYHRYEVLKRIGCETGWIVDLRLPFDEAVQLTVLMNRIKGMHQVERMSDLVVKLADLGLEDSEICKNLGMEAEELIRLKQQLGIAEVFRDRDYGRSWTVE